MTPTTGSLLLVLVLCSVGTWEAVNAKKPGMCPVVNTFAPCHHPYPPAKCHHDSQCPHQQKCCDYGCRWMCVEPVTQYKTCRSRCQREVRNMLHNAARSHGSDVISGSLRRSESLMGSDSGDAAPEINMTPTTGSLLLVLVLCSVGTWEAVNAKKPGMCPVVNTFAPCAQPYPPAQCHHDSQCPHQQKCCDYGCIWMCVDPVTHG
ncbi:uncharacterized protein LOC142491876 [Ascaphus truei]|uniref:uncharacterized protein LOC142491876 n=1 Tax=Ascaphus truei TaxID=8439 RepID=UPI003F59C150